MSFPQAVRPRHRDKHIGCIDADGVNMAAVKALYELSKRQQRRLDDQQARIERLERAISALADR